MQLRITIEGPGEVLHMQDGSRPSPISPGEENAEISFEFEGKFVIHVEELDEEGNPTRTVFKHFAKQVKSSATYHSNYYP